MTPLQQRAVDIRARLRCPPNAVADTGINMRNGWPVRLRRKPVERLKLAPAPPVAKAAPEPLWEASRSKNMIRLIIGRVCKEWNIDLIELLSHRRQHYLCVPRQVAMAVALKLTPLSSMQLGRHFGRDHSTILHARRVMAGHMNAVAIELGSDAAIQEWVRALKARLEA